MKSVSLAICVVLVLIGAYASRVYQKQSIQSDDKQVLSEKVDIQSQPTLQVTETPTPTQTPMIAQATITQSPSSKISGLVYPGATVKNQTASSASMESSDDTDKITDWYKSKIEAMGMNVKSFVKTKANEEVLNKLSAANGAREINVDISKESESALVRIMLTLTNF